MIFFQDSKIINMTVGTVGNKSLDEGLIVPLSVVDLNRFDMSLQEYLKSFFSKPFSKASIVYEFYHGSDNTSFNVVYSRAFDFFNRKTHLLGTMQFLIKDLYDVITHPKIKGGDFFVVHFGYVMFEGEEHEALGLYLSDSKEPSLAVQLRDGSFDFILTDQSVNLNSLNKAALILNKGARGTVLISDCANSTDAIFWKDSFLELKARNDDFLKTSTFMKITKAFVGEKLDEVFEVETAEKTDLMNRSLAYFKEKDEMDVEEFSEEIFGTKAAELFVSYLKDFEEEFEVKIGESFGISPVAVKKQQASFKQVIKLDKNFHLYVHGKRELLERGYDEDKGMNYYKVYFNNEG